MSRHTTAVLTAGPTAGKSSTIRELSGRGYYTVPEAARIYFDQRISEGDDPHDVKQEPTFHDSIESIDQELDASVPATETGVVFSDRGYVDNLAYRRHANAWVPEHVFDACVDRYDYVFLLDRLEHRDDPARTEDESEATELHETIRTAYEETGHDVIEIPVMDVETRANMIESHVFGDGDPR